MILRYSQRLAFAVAAAAVALGSAVQPAGAQAAGGTMAPAAAPKVTIVSPKNGEVVTGPSVHVVLAVQGVEIAPAAEHRPGTAHHHLFLDVNVTAADSAIPAGVAGITHLGKGQTEYTYDTVAPGAHRLIDVLGDPNHVPLKPMVADTVHFTVK
ncbi:MAG TPA: DUF4399 domain-containing protein [Gemmatimonadales bacterium]|nr:DUF4399 domain-containing protein [Gemmatimonadales bacterium]